MITWELVGGATSLIVVVQTFTLFVVRAIVASEVAKINGTYIRRGECILAREAEERQAADLKHRLDRLEDRDA